MSFMNVWVNKIDKKSGLKGGMLRIKGFDWFCVFLVFIGKVDFKVICSLL